LSNTQHRLAPPTESTQEPSQMILDISIQLLVGAIAQLYGAIVLGGESVDR
jgi:hypothetical protein